MAAVPPQDCLKPLSAMDRFPPSGEFVTLAREPEQLGFNPVIYEHTEQLLALFDLAPEVVLGVNDEAGRRDSVRMA